MSHDFLNFILAVAIIIVAAKLSGYISIRLGQPSVLGELIAGLVLGPTLLNMLHWPIFAHSEPLAETIKMMAELGVIFLMMLAGLELHLNELVESGKVSALAGTLGVILPLLMGWGLGIAFGTSNTQAVFIGLALSATSVSISAQTLMELNVLRSPVGLALLGAAVFDDILVILLLSIAAILFSGGAAGGVGEIGMTVLLMVGYLVVAVLLGLYVIPTLARLANRLPVSQGIIAFTIVLVLLYAWAAEVIGGMAAITGAFLVGLFLARTPYKSRIESGIVALAYGFFVPIFFVNIGLEVNMRGITGNMWWFAIALTLVAIISKIVGCGGGALIAGFSRKDSLRLGIGMVSRGEVGLIVASFAVSAGLLNPENFSIVVFMVIVATLVTPPLLRAVYASEETSQPADQTPTPA